MIKKEITETLSEDWPQPPKGFAKDLPSINVGVYCPKCGANDTAFKYKFISDYNSWQYPKSIDDFNIFKKSAPNYSWSDYQISSVHGEHLFISCGRCEYKIGEFKCKDISIDEAKNVNKLLQPKNKQKRKHTWRVYRKLIVI